MKPKDFCCCWFCLINPTLLFLSHTPQNPGAKRQVSGQSSIEFQSSGDPPSKPHSPSCDLLGDMGPELPPFQGSRLSPVTVTSLPQQEWWGPRGRTRCQ